LLYDPVPEEEIMSKKVTIIILLVVTAAVLLLAGCERSASPTTLATPTTGTVNKKTQTAQAALGSPTPQATGLSLVQAWGTSTAIYVQTAVATGLFTAVPTSPSPANQTPGVPPTGAPASTLVPGVSTPVPAIPTATPGRPATYTLHKGEFPYCLARRFNVDPADLLSLNGLSNGVDLQPGLTLKIPQSGSFPGSRSLHNHPATYTVQVDDTIYSIACYFGDLDPTSIAALGSITTGTVLNVP
jgi:LysM repeat protein